MKAVIFCGGRGTRLDEVSGRIPKPLVPIGERPILWHIMKLFSHHGINDFVLCLGYKSWMFKDYFLNYEAMTSDIQVRVGRSAGYRVLKRPPAERWNIVLAETGLNATTGERLKRVERYLAKEKRFMVTYGDGLADIDLSALLRFHRRHGKLGTVTGVQPLARFGHLTLNGETVTRFAEKARVPSGPINGGFFAFERAFLDRLREDGEPMLEREPLMRLAKDAQLRCFRHERWWMPMDTPREHEELNRLWSGGAPPWKLWNE